MRAMSIIMGRGKIEQGMELPLSAKTKQHGPDKPSCLKHMDKEERKNIQTKSFWDTGYQAMKENNPSR